MIIIVNNIVKCFPPIKLPTTLIITLSFTVSTFALNKIKIHFYYKTEYIINRTYSK